MLLQLHVWVIPQNDFITMTALHPWQGEALHCIKHLAGYHVFEVMFSVRMTIIPQHQDSKICVEWKCQKQKHAASALTALHVESKSKGCLVWDMSAPWSVYTESALKRRAVAVSLRIGYSGWHVDVRWTEVMQGLISLWLHESSLSVPSLCSAVAFSVV